MSPLQSAVLSRTKLNHHAVYTIEQSRRYGFNSCASKHSHRNYSSMKNTTDLKLTIPLAKNISLAKKAAPGTNVTKTVRQSTVLLSIVQRKSRPSKNRRLGTSDSLKSNALVSTSLKAAAPHNPIKSKTVATYDFVRESWPSWFRSLMYVYQVL